MRPAPVLLLFSAVLPGCLPDLTLPSCVTDSDCLAIPGFCTCQAGLCFRFGCPASVGEGGGQAASDAASETADVAGPGVDGGDATSPCIGDGCCPDDLLDRTGVAACTVASGAILSPGVIHPASVSETGRVFVVAETSGEARLLAFEPTLAPAWSQPLGSSPPAAVETPVVLADGRVAVSRPDGLSLFAAEDGALSVLPYAGTSSPASAPVQRPASGALLTVSASGYLVETRLDGTSLTSTAPVAPASPPFLLASSPSADLLFVVDGAGGLSVVAIGQTVSAAAVFTWTEGEATTAPAIGGSGLAAYVGTAGGKVGGVVRLSGVWQPVDNAGVGLDPEAPIIGAQETVIVPSAGSKQVSAVRYAGTVPMPLWQAGPTVLADAPVTPAVLAGASLVCVGLNSGRLTCLDASSGSASGSAKAAWYHDLPGASAGAPLTWPDGSILHMTATGALRRLVAPPRGDTSHPWPRFRHDRRSSASAGPG